MSKRPWRSDFFRKIGELIATAPSGEVLELGSGPGFLAEQMVLAAPHHRYTLLDFSDAMHDLAKARLAGARNVRHLTRDFRGDGWSEGLGPFDIVVTMQAVHELRHKSRATSLHSRVREVLRPGGAYIVCDHYAGEDGMEDNQLYTTVAEQKAALEAAGFRVREILRLRGLVMHHAENTEGEAP